MLPALPYGWTWYATINENRFDPQIFGGAYMLNLFVHDANDFAVCMDISALEDCDDGTIDASIRNLAIKIHARLGHEFAVRDAAIRVSQNLGLPIRVASR